MSTYPLKVYRTPGPDSLVVNNGTEEDAATKAGYHSELPAHDEFPKMLFLHPVDKTKEHKTIVVSNPAEKDAAMKDGYKLNPHVPVIPEEDSFDRTAYEGAPYDGSGSERWEHGAWTETVGAGLTDDTSKVPTQAEADAVTAQAEAERQERAREAESEGKPVFDTDLVPAT